MTLTTLFTKLPAQGSLGLWLVYIAGDRLGYGLGLMSCIEIGRRDLTPSLAM